MISDILVVEEEVNLALSFESFLNNESYRTTLAHNASQTQIAINQHNFDLVILAIDTYNLHDLTLLQEVRKRQPHCPIVLLTQNPSVETATKALRLGVFDYISKPLTQQTLLQVTERAISVKRLADETERAQTTFKDIVTSISDAIVTIDPQGRFSHFNPAALAHFGFKQPPIGKTPEQLHLPCDNICLTLLTEVLVHQRPIERYRQKCQHPDRPGYIFSAHCHPLLSDQGLFSGVVLVLRVETHFVRCDPTLRQNSRFHNLIGQTLEMRRLYVLIDKLAKVTSSVLIKGESGTGKELVAEALHHNGPRCKRPFVRVNCAGLSETLLDSELFGHVKGAFTGAIRDRCGRFELAQGGTIFLDEIGDISHNLQLKLLRVLQEKEIERVGDATPIPVDVRIIAATHKNLQERIRLGLFREDLYFRLKVVRLRIPPLRQRVSDIPLLVDHFIDRYCQQFNKAVIGVSDNALQHFANYSWPGNVRELKHMLEHAFIFNETGLIDVDDLPEELVEVPCPAPATLQSNDQTEEQQLHAALTRSGGNKAKAARLLNISRQTLYRKLNEYHID
jgi:DNA-binding NtrC family response regulator